MARRVDLTPWARQGLGPDGVERLNDLVPTGCKVIIVRSARRWVARVSGPGHEPVRIETLTVAAAADEAIGQLRDWFPGVLVG